MQQHLLLRELLHSSRWQMNKSRMLLLGGSFLWGISSLLLGRHHHMLLL